MAHRILKRLVVFGLCVFGGSAMAAVLATAGKNQITVEEFKRRLNEIIKQEPPQLPTNEEFLEDLIRFEIGVQEAERLKLQDDPVVKERFRQVLYNALLEKQLQPAMSKIRITESELKSFYSKNPELRLAHIFIDMKSDANPKERAEARNRAQEIFNEVKASKRPFDELVKLYSDDHTTKELGGDIGCKSRVTLAPVIYETASKMRPGEVKGLVETKFGFHILKLIERCSYDLADKHQVRAALYEEKRAKIFDDYFQQLKRKYKITINQEAARSLFR